MAAARLALGLHNASADWTKSLIANSSKPSGTLIWSGHGRMPPQLLGISGGQYVCELQGSEPRLLADDRAAAVVSAMSAAEKGLELAWQTHGALEAQRLTFADEGGRAWPVCHLRAEDGQLSWVRRGADLPESSHTSQFSVQFDTGTVFADATRLHAPLAAIPAEAIAARVAETGADGRIDPWVPISLGTP